MHVFSVFVKSYQLETKCRSNNWYASGLWLRVTAARDFLSHTSRKSDHSSNFCLLYRGIRPKLLCFQGNIMTSVSHQQWGRVPSGQPVDLWVLQSSEVQVEVLTLGAIIKSLHCRGNDSQMKDILLGYDDLDGYVSDRRYHGAVVGRVANRIARGCFTIDGRKYQLDTNNGPNALHGGLKGFSKCVWQASAMACGVRLTLNSPDGDQGFPGELQVSVCYTLREGTLTAEYEAQCTKTTPINLTNHSYFNLAGQEITDIYDHKILINAHNYLPVDDTSIPTGEIRAVDGTPFDLRSPVQIGSQLKKLTETGFDHNFCLSAPGDNWTERFAARVCHPATGRVMEVFTSQPGVQFYTANVLDGSVTGKKGRRYGKHSAFCLETQNWPDAVNQNSFPDCLLHPGHVYHHVTRYVFSTL